jgi:hypothetical protein
VKSDNQNGNGNGQGSFNFDEPPRLEPEPRAVARRTDPDTSWEAAESFSPEQLTRIQTVVLEYFRRVHRSTDEEMLKALSYMGFHHSTLETRRSELVTREFLVDSGERVLNSRNRNVVVWRLVA